MVLEFWFVRYQLNDFLDWPMMGNNGNGYYSAEMEFLK